MGGRWLYLTPSAWLRAERRVLIIPPGPRSHGGHVNQNLSLLSYLLILHCMEDLGTCGELGFPPGLGKS